MHASTRPKLHLRPLTFVVASLSLAALASPACSRTAEPPELGAGAFGARGGVAGRSGSAGNPVISVDAGGMSTRGGAAGSSAAGSGAVIDVGEGGAAGEQAGAAGAGGASPLGPDEACALSTTTVEAVPPVLELVIDTSGSMDWPPGWAPVTPDDSKPPGATKWEITREALRAAVVDLDRAVALGVVFYPNTTDADDDSVCLRDDVAVPIAALGAASSAQRKRFEAALDGVVPYGATPTEGAYLFGLDQLAGTSLPGDRFVLLITDGTPTCTVDCTCTENNEPVDSKPLLADASQARDEGVRTFVIGSPGSEDTRDVLSALATNGGTPAPGCSDDGPLYCHLDMTAEPDLSAGLARALRTVASGVRSCAYPVPAAPDDRTLDPERVNVLFTTSDGKTSTVPRDGAGSGCEGWHYSDDGSSIVLCGAACDAAVGDVGSSVEILLGCKTIIREPR